MDLAKLETMQARAMSLASELRMAKCAAMDCGDEAAHDALERAEDKADEARALIGNAMDSLRR